MEAAEELYGQQLRFSFTKLDVKAAVEEIKDYYSEAVCDRIERVILEQMRKYPIFF